MYYGISQIHLKYFCIFTISECLGLQVSGAFQSPLLHRHEFFFGACILPSLQVPRY